MYIDYSIHPCRLAMDFAADESTQTRTLGCQPKSAAKAWMPSPSAAALAKAYSSASPLDVAIVA